MYFSLLLQRKGTKRKQLKEPLLRKGFFEISPKGGGIFAFKAKMLPTNDNLHNDPPIKRTAFFRAGLLEIWLACRLVSRTFVRRCDILCLANYGSLTEVILWER